MENLKRLRKERNLTTREMAENINTSKTAFNNWETGKTEPSIEYLKALSDFFCVSVDYLIDNEPKRETPAPSSHTLSQNEKELLKAFNKLSPFEQDSMLVQIKALAENSSLIKK